MFKFILVSLLNLSLSLSLSVEARAARVLVNGRSVHYSATGSGRAIIFVHGWTCDQSTWSNQVKALETRYRVITLDLPGHGKSDLPARDDYTMEAFADAVEAVRDASRATRVVLVGHSMGAGVIRRYALKYPQHTAGLVAVEGPLDVRPFAAIPADQPPMTPDARRQLVERMFVPETSAAIRDQVRKTMLGTSTVAANGSSGSMFSPLNQSSRIINVPALTIYAGSPLFPIDRKTVEMIPKWEWKQVSGTGHFVMMEKPEPVAAMLKAFLSRRVRW